jgi:hypothetical protein
MADVDGALLRASVEGLLRGDFPVDSDLIKGVYWKSPSRLRPDVAALSVVSFLAPAQFRRLWSDALRASATSGQRAPLAEGLAAFLNRNPSQSRHYSRHIREFCRDRSLVARRAGILLLSALDEVGEADLDVVMRSLAGADADARLAALGAIQRWALRGSRAPAKVKKFIDGDEVHKQVARARKAGDTLIREAASNCARLLGPRRGASASMKFRKSGRQA